MHHQRPPGVSPSAPDGSAPSTPSSRRSSALFPVLFALVVLVLAVVATLLGSRPLRAEEEVDAGPFDEGSLKRIPVPRPPEAVLAEFVADEKAAIALGKALFWDTSVGSDNTTACASCHFNAGADSRTSNQLNPGHLAGDNTFQLGGPNFPLLPEDFPIAGLDGPTPPAVDINDVVGSQGVFAAAFNGHGTNGAIDDCSRVSDSILDGGHGFNVNGVNTRQVAPRNAPSVINAVYNFRNFWDGRGNNTFNGGDPFGLRNGNALVWVLDGSLVKQVRVSIPSSSLASQGVGPPLSAVEMSCGGRSFMKLGKKLLDRPPLANQAIAPDDSILAGVARLRASSPGYSYAHLVRAAFKPKYWRATRMVRLTGTDENRFAPMDLPPRRGYPRTTEPYEATQMEANFALFFGLAVQLYQSTLVSNDSPFDRYLDGDASALTAQQVRGLEVFTGRGRCDSCHSGPELTNASFRNVLNERLELMSMGDDGSAVYDNGFYNIGVRPSAEDRGVGGSDPFGLPLSETRMVQIGRASMLGNGFDATRNPAVPADRRVAVEGAFKAPGLRNVEFTGPYFHNGGYATLMQVVEFYNRGGDFAATNRNDLAPDIRPLGLEEQEKQDLVAFLLALTDDRVRHRRAPFDHPAICIPREHASGPDALPAQNGTSGNAVDTWHCLQAVGASGSTAPLHRFLELDPFAR